MLFFGHGSQTNKTGTNYGAGQADLSQQKHKSLVSRPFQLGRPTGSTGVVCGSLLKLVPVLLNEIHDRKKHALGVLKNEFQSLILCT